MINLRRKNIIINVDEFSVDSLTFNNRYLHIEFVHYIFITGSTFYESALFVNLEMFSGINKHKVAITINNSNFSRSINGSGAIKINTDICHMHITNCTFEHNYDFASGGAIQVSANVAVVLHINGCDFYGGPEVHT